MFRSISFILPFLFFTSCNTANKNDQGSSKKLSTDYIINFRPSFDEKSVINISESEGVKTLSVLLTNHIRLGPDEDSFYYYKQQLNADQSNFIDSCLANTFSIKPPPREPEIILDGIFFNIIKSIGKDSTYIFSDSPDSIRNREEFLIALNTISNLKIISSDTIVVNYLDDIRRYFQDIKQQKNTPLMKRRELIYNMKYIQ